MKNLLTQWESEEKNRKVIDNVGRKIVNEKVVEEKYSYFVLVKTTANLVEKLRR